MTESRMERDDLVRLTASIMEARGSEEEVDEMLDLLRENVPDPNVSDLIYYADPELTAEQVVDAAMEYKPFAL
ncbi:hypothetical protein ACFYT7_23445 [Streptomyces sp. NPDC004041]|uniref:hypothetical protein n=1 Tax=unclassified Streptomyces TaxID=2593676 RepID=UPI0036B1F3AD